MIMLEMTNFMHIIYFFPNVSLLVKCVLPSAFNLGVIPYLVTI
nr:MAG TPA: hypothetical protein [Caudoviricetes sp.]